MNKNMINKFYFVLYYFLLRPGLSYYTLIFIFYILFNIKYSSLILLDGDSIYELDGRPVEVHNNSQQTYESNHNNRGYSAYHPGDIQTSEGYVFELDGREISGRYNNISSHSNFYQPLSSDSLPPVVDYNTKPTYHSETSYNYQQDFNRSTNARNLIEPTRSHLDREGIHFGTQINPHLRKSVPKYSFAKDLKNRIISLGQKAEKKYQDSANKHIDRQINFEEAYKKSHSFQQCPFSEMYVKKYGRLTRAEVLKFYRDGYIIKNGKLKKI